MALPSLAFPGSILLEGWSTRPLRTDPGGGHCGGLSPFQQHCQQLALSPGRLIAQPRGVDTLQALDVVKLFVRKCASSCPVPWSIWDCLRAVVFGVKAFTFLRVLVGGLAECLDIILLLSIKNGGPVVKFPPADAGGTGWNPDLGGSHVSQSN